MADFLELLARFELATRSNAAGRIGASRPRIEILTAYAVRADEVAGSLKTNKKNSNPKWNRSSFGAASQI